MPAKTNPGRFFEDYAVGQTLIHAVPRTVSGGERALYHALYPARHALYSSDEFARGCGLPESPLDDLAAFHVVFGKTVPDVSLNAVANLGYAEGRWLRPVYAGDTLHSASEVIGLKQNSNGKTGVVYVRTTGTNQRGEPVMEYVRWVMVRKNDPDAPAPEVVVPELNAVIPAEDLVIPEGLDFSRYDVQLAVERCSGELYDMAAAGLGEEELRARISEQDAHLGRTYAEIQRLEALVAEMRSTRAWRLHSRLQRLKGGVAAEAGDPAGAGEGGGGGTGDPGPGES